MATKKFKKKNVEKRNYRGEGVLKGTVISHFVRKVSTIFRVISEKLPLKGIKNYGTR